MFAHARATTVAPASTEALPVSVRRKARSGVSLLQFQMVRPEKGAPDSGAEVEDSVTPDSSASRGIERPYPFPAAPSILPPQSVSSVDGGVTWLVTDPGNGQEQFRPHGGKGARIHQMAGTIRIRLADGVGEV